MAEVVATLDSTGFYTVDPNYEQWGFGFKKMDSVRARINNASKEFLISKNATALQLVQHFNEAHKPMIPFRDSFCQLIDDGGSVSAWKDKNEKKAQAQLLELQKQVKELRENLVEL